jgi:exodeoxyribonuclease VII small subunit
MAKKKRNESEKDSLDQTVEVDFESALTEVERVVHQLESGELGLSESLEQYERGIEKIKLCHQVLQRVEKRIAVLTSVDEDGTVSIEPVDVGREGETGLASKPTTRRGARKNRPPVSDVDDSGGLF